MYTYVCLYSLSEGVQITQFDMCMCMRIYLCAVFVFAFSFALDLVHSKNSFLYICVFVCV